MGTRTFILILMCYSALANYPVFDVTTQMRSILVPASVKLGTIIYRLRASDTDKDYPLSFDATGKPGSGTTKTLRKQYYAIKVIMLIVSLLECIYI